MLAVLLAPTVYGQNSDWTILLGYSDINGFPGQQHLELGVNLLVFIDRESTFAPYLLAGAGYLRTSTDNAGEESRPTLNLGVGVKWALGDSAVSISVVSDPPPVLDSNGCERDDDADRVFNRLDQCPNSPAGVRVDIYGCEIKDVIALSGVNFKTNSDRLLLGAAQVLSAAAATLKMHADLRVEVAGHTDSVGNAAANESLSVRRAIMVRDFLIAAGVNAANLSAKGYGETRPVADNASLHGRTANRRVELIILNR